MKKILTCCSMVLIMFGFLVGCADDNGGSTPAVIPPTVATPPTVTLTVPARAVTGVPINRDLAATFSTAMDPTTINDTTFTLRVFNSSGVPAIVTGAVTLDSAGIIATFNPTSDLATATTYTAMIAKEVKDLAGTAMAAEYDWSFTTALTADTTRPTVLSTAPVDLAAAVAINSAVTATFSEAMNSVTIVSPATSFTVEETLSGTPVAGVVTYLGATATFTPAGDLLPATDYLSTITIAAEDLAGNAIAVDHLWDWTTAAEPDIEPPTVTVTNPADLATEVPIDKTINAAFSEEMKQATMINTNFTVQETDTEIPVVGTVAYDVQNNIATFVADNPLIADTEYTVTVTDQATDLAGNALVVPAENDLPVPNPWTFTTAAEILEPEPLAINLRGAATFGLAARAGLTSTGVTVINGDVALSPNALCTDATGNAGASQDCLVQTYSSPTGMTVNGSIYWSGDAFDNGGTADSVTNDLSIAWTEARDKVDTEGPVAGDELGGKIFEPGVYHNATLGLQAGGTATFDALNDANAIFIFKVDSSFVDSGTLLLPTEIVLINGAQARNVWFVTGLDITIGSGTTWFGNILAGRDATVNDGSTVTGRVLAGASGAGAFVLTGAADPSVTTITVPE
jgi:hypothetical protein